MSRITTGQGFPPWSVLVIFEQSRDGTTYQSSGDIENILVELAKQGAKSGGGGLLGFAQSVLSAASGGKKFSKEDVKKVYFVSAIQLFEDV